MWAPERSDAPSTVRSRRRLIIGGVILLLVVASSSWPTSFAAFTRTTANTGTSLAAGTVGLSDDDSGTAAFTVSGMQPGSFGSRCVTVTYTGSVASSVKLYVPSGGLGDSGLAAYLAMTVEQGTGGSFASCTGFVPGSTLYTGTLAGLALTASSFATGLGTFAPAANGTSSVYRISYQLAGNNAAQSGTCTVGFTWEGRSA